MCCYPLHSMQFSSNTERPVLAVSMQPGKDRLAPKGNNIVYLLDWTLGCPLRQLDTGHEEAACDLSMAFSTQGRYLITGSSSGKVSVWTTASGLLINEIRLQEDVPVRSVTFSGNGHTLAIGSESGRVELYNIVTGKPFFLPEQYEQHPIMALSFSKSGDSLTAGYTDGTVQVWNGESRTVSPLHVRKGFQVTLVVFRYTQEVAWSTQCFPVYAMFPSLHYVSQSACIVSRAMYHS
eukprot:scpid102184/ scgid6156/ Vegetative incompatibility protein HET-E-1